MYRQPRLLDATLLLLLDEPTSALDSGTRDEVAAELISRLEQLGIPALAATHDVGLATMADWVVLLDQGCIIQQGPPAQVMAAPAGTAAAALLGLRNRFAGQLLRQQVGGITRLALLWPAGGGVRLDLPARDATAAGDAVDWMIHPNDVRVHRKEAGRPGSMAGEVEQVAVSGTGCLLGIRIGAALLWAAPMRDGTDAPEPRRGDAVAVELPAKRICIWPQRADETGHG